MKPAWPLVLSTALAGTGQGLVVALVAAEVARPAPAAFQLAGSALALGLLAAGFAASLFCLGRRERAAARSRASWDALEAIVLRAFIGAILLWASARALGFARTDTLAIGAATLVLDAALFLCTGMKCAGVALVRERARRLTPLAFALLGTASGFSLSVPLAVLAHPPFAGPLALAAFWLAALGWIARGIAFLRNVRYRPAARGGAAIGRSARLIAALRVAFLACFFPVPGWLLGWGGGTFSAVAAAFLVQFAALMTERWLFFAEARCPHSLCEQPAA
ncbi:MAG: hypothetical protein N2653_06795 [Burkholderiales bacterium]|nr:hypothetical protein [Burkholderiales bacterium]